MATVLDDRDRRLAFELWLNARQPLSHVSRKVRLSKAGVDYRLKNLVRAGVFKAFLTVVDFGKLGFQEYRLFLRLQNAGEKEENELADFLAKDRRVCYVASCRGGWDLVASVLARSPACFCSFLEDLEARFGAFLLQEDALLVCSVSAQPLALDETDARLLAVLSANGRMPLSEVAEKAGVSRDVATYRFGQLKRSGVIAGFRAWLDYEKVSMQPYRLLLGFKGMTPPKRRELKVFFNAQERVQRRELIGSWDWELEIAVENEDRLYVLLAQLRESFSDVLRDFQVLRIRGEHACNTFPPAVRDAVAGR